MDAADLTEAAEWSTGIVSEDSTGAVQVESRLFYQGTVEGGGAANELSRLTDAREKSEAVPSADSLRSRLRLIPPTFSRPLPVASPRCGILGSALAYAGR